MLRKIRQQNSLTQLQVSELLNIDRSTYTYYETGKTNPDIYQLVKLARMYKLTPNDLLEFKQKESNTGSLVFKDDSTFVKSNSRNVNMLELEDDEKRLVYMFRLMSDEDKEETLAQSKEKLIK